MTAGLKITLRTAAGGLSLAAVSLSACSVRDIEICENRQRQLRDAGSVVDGSIWVMFEPAVSRTQAESIVQARGYSVDAWLTDGSTGMGEQALVRVRAGDECTAVVTLRESPDVHEANLRELAGPGR